MKIRRKKYYDSPERKKMTQTKSQKYIKNYKRKKIIYIKKAENELLEK